MHYISQTLMQHIFHQLPQSPKKPVTGQNVNPIDLIRVKLLKLFQKQFSFTKCVFVNLILVMVFSVIDDTEFFVTKSFCHFITLLKVVQNVFG